MTDNNGNDGHPPKVLDEACSRDGSAVSASTFGTHQSNSAPTGTVTVQVVPSSEDGTHSSQSAARKRIVTTHRKTLDYITSDSFQNKRHHVPDQKRPRSSTWSQKRVGALHSTWKSRTKSEWLEIFLPMCKWLKVYEWKENLLQDIIAGCTVGVMIVPQSMSYAKLAGLPVEYGLYSALVPVYAYALFGSSRQLAVGPVALVSLLLSTGLTHELEKLGKTPDNTPNYQEVYNQLAIQVSFLVGCMYIALGLLR